MLLSSPACRHSNIPLAQEAFSFQSGRSELKLKPSHLCFSYSSCSEHAWKGLRELRRSSKRRGGLLRQGLSTRASSISTEDKLSSIGETGKEEAMTEEETGVVIVGAGLAGLSAARQLARANVPFLLVEASDGVGGRVRTDSFRGFQLDRGFQLLLSGYPETREVLDYDALKLQNFYAGALVKLDSGFHRVADPLKHPVHGILSLFNPVGTLLDKILVGLVRYRAIKKSVDEILSAKEVSTLERLRSEGFSTSMIDKFFRPFFGGVFFDKELATTSRLFEFIFRAFALGDNALPAGGMGAISQQLADALPQASIRLNSKVEALLLGGSSPGVKLRSGAIIKSKHGVVVAVEGPEAARLLGTSLDTAVTARPPRQSLTVYFSADKPPHPEPILFLNGSGKGIVNSLVVISNVAPSYAPPGKSLISASVIPRSLDRDDVAGLEQVVRRELEDWFGAAEVAKWEHLRTDTIVYGQPDQTLPTDLAREVRLGAGLYVCGDHRDHATTHGALVSGKRAAQALMADAKVIQ